MINSNNLPSIRFKFQQRIAATIAFAPSILLIVFFAVIAVVRHQFSYEFFIFLWLVSFLYLFFGVLILTQKSDVLVNCNGISRFLFNKVWQSIVWNDIAVIREFSIISNNKVLRGIHIFFPKVPFFRFTLGKKIVLSEDIDNFEALVDILNCYVLKYKLKVERKINGEWQLIESLHLKFDENHMKL